MFPPSPSRVPTFAAFVAGSILILGSVLRAGGDPLEEDQILRLSFDGDLNDASGRGNHATFFGGEPFFGAGFDGTTGGALSFDGVDDYLQIPTGNGFPVFDHDEFTVSMWVNAHAGQNDRRIYSEGSSRGDAPLFTLETEFNGADGTVDAFVRAPDGDLRLQHVKSRRTAFDGTWHHIAWVDRRGHATLYVDGVLDPVDFTYVKPTLSLDRVAIGAILRADVRLHYAGAVGEVRVFTRALSVAEIQFLAAVDCNENGIADTLDIEDGTSEDFDGNGVPDECQDALEERRLVEAFIFGARFLTCEVPDEPGRTYSVVRHVAGQPGALEYDPFRGWGFEVLDPGSLGRDGFARFGPFDETVNERDRLDDDCPEEIYDSHIGFKDHPQVCDSAVVGNREDPCELAMSLPGDSLYSPSGGIFRVDVPNGRYRFVVASGDSLGPHAVRLLAEDGGDGIPSNIGPDHVTLIDNFDANQWSIGQVDPSCLGCGVYAGVGFDDRIPPAGNGVAPDPVFVNMGPDGRPTDPGLDGEFGTADDSPPDSPTLRVARGFIRFHVLQGNANVGPGSRDGGTVVDANGGDINLLEIWRIREPDPDDCNENGVLDETEIADAPSLDLDADDVLDECQPSHPVRLELGEPVPSSCSDEVRRVGVTARLSTAGVSCDGPGAESWTIGLESEGCTFVEATTEGTAAGESPDGFRSGGFEMTEIVDDGTRRAVTSSVVLSEPSTVNLPPCDVHDILAIELEAPAPNGTPCTRCRLRYSAGSTVTIRGVTVVPDLDTAYVEFCPCGVDVQLVPEEANRCVVGILRNEIPIRGGELGLAYDPLRIAGASVEPGSDFPGMASHLISRFDAPSSCDDEPGAGLAIGWLNHGTGELLPPGEYELFRICFVPADGPEGGFCSDLRSIDCLGVPEAPVINKVIDENNETVRVPAMSVQVCGSETVFRRGDPNADGLFDISDPIGILGCLFLGTECTECPDAADANDDNEVNIADPLRLLDWRFNGGPPPPAPFPRCGIDRTADELGDCEGAACE